MSPDDQVIFFEAAVRHGNLGEALYEVASDRDSLRGNHDQYFAQAAKRAFEALEKHIRASTPQEAGEAEGPGCYELPHPLLVPVARVLRQRDALAKLCGEILSTIRDRSRIGPVGGLLGDGTLAKWQERFTKESGK